MSILITLLVALIGLATVYYRFKMSPAAKEARCRKWIRTWYVLLKEKERAAYRHDQRSFIILSDEIKKHEKQRPKGCEE